MSIFELLIYLLTYADNTTACCHAHSTVSQNKLYTFSQTLITLTAAKFAQDAEKTGQKSSATYQFTGSLNR